MPEDRYWTAFIAWSDDDNMYGPKKMIQLAESNNATVEEIDIETWCSEKTARAKVKEILANEYDPGGVIIEMQVRYKGIIYF
jgi:hypothetical protein